MDKGELEGRTKGFALQVVRFVSGLPKSKVTDVLGYQLLKSGTSIGANYREANRAESSNDFIHKIALVEKEVKFQFPISNFQFRNVFSIFTAAGKTVRARWK